MTESLRPHQESLTMDNFQQTLVTLGAKPSMSEEKGLALLRNDDLTVFCPGVSSGGFAEIRMALANKKRRIVATTIDTEGLNFTANNIRQLNLTSRIELKLENLLTDFPYPSNFFDYIYARLVLHYLSAQDLDKVLSNFKKSLKKSGHIFIVVRSEKCVDSKNADQEFDPATKLTKTYYRDGNNKISCAALRYFHTQESIRDHLEKAGFNIDYISEHVEQLYKDFMRTQIAPHLDYLIEVHAKNM